MIILTKSSRSGFREFIIIVKNQSLQVYYVSFDIPLNENIWILKQVYLLEDLPDKSKNRVRTRTYYYINSEKYNPVFSKKSQKQYLKKIKQSIVNMAIYMKKSDLKYFPDIYIEYWSSFHDDLKRLMKHLTKIN
jgi:hypothetical protein